MSEVDLPAYLNRIGLAGVPAPTESALRAVVAAHTQSIPFENLDPLTGVAVQDLSGAALSDKLIRRRRGGFCYEHSGLLGYALEDLGYDVVRLAARVVWQTEPGSPPPPSSHVALSVGVPGDDCRFLVDVGFGGQTPTSPLRLEVGSEQRTTHEPYRLVTGGPIDDGTELTLQTRLPDGWRALYAFTLRPAPLIDLHVGSWYVSTHPDSGFVTGLRASLATADARWNLRGRRFAVHTGGATERTILASADEVLDTLSTRFGIVLADVGDRDALRARVGAVLDA